jgi:hypothetical protein
LAGLIDPLPSLGTLFSILLLRCPFSQEAQEKAAKEIENLKQQHKVAIPGAHNIYAALEWECQPFVI